MTDRLEKLDQLNLFVAVAARRGSRWEIMVHGPDDITRPLHPVNPRFWRRTTAERICSAFNSSVQTSAWIALGQGTNP